MAYHGRPNAEELWRVLKAGRDRKASQPKAWTGSNPSIRPTSTNGPPKSQSPGSAPTQQNKSSTDAHADKHAHDRMLFLFSQLVVRIVLLLRLA